MNIFKSATSALSVKPFLCVVCYIFLWNIACAMFTAAQPYMMTHYLEMSTGAISLVYTIYVFMVLVCTPLVSKFAQSVGSKKAMLVVLAILTLACLVFKFIPYSVPILYVHNFTMALTIVGWSVLAYAMVYDISEVAHLKTKIDNKGMYLSLFQFAIKLSGAVGTWLLGMLLSHYQYDAAAETISDYTLTGIQNIYTIFPAIFIFLSIIAIWLYSLSTDNVNKLKELVKRQDAGETIDEAEYKGLL